MLGKAGAVRAWHNWHSRSLAQVTKPELVTKLGITGTGGAWHKWYRRCLKKLKEVKLCSAWGWHILSLVQLAQPELGTTDIAIDWDNWHSKSLA